MREGLRAPIPGPWGRKDSLGSGTPRSSEGGRWALVPWVCEREDGEKAEGLERPTERGLEANILDPEGKETW